MTEDGELVAGESAGAPIDLPPTRGGGEPASERSAGPRQLSRGAVWAGITIGVVAVAGASILVRLAREPLTLASDAEELGFALALSFWRCALGALALAPFAIRARRGAPSLDRGQRLQLGGAGVLLAVHFVLFIGALFFTTVASAAVLVTMAPLFVAIGSAAFLAEPPTRRMWMGIALASGGALAVGAADLGAGDLGIRALVGDAMAFGGAAAVAGYLLIGRAARRRLPVSVYAGVVYGVAAVVLGTAALLVGAPLGGYPTATWLAIAGLVLGPQLLGHTVFNALLSSVSATVVAIVVIAEPVGATILAWALLAELPPSMFFLGAPFILAGVVVAARGSR